MLYHVYVMFLERVVVYTLLVLYVVTLVGKTSYCGILRPRRAPYG